MSTPSPADLAYLDRRRAGARARWLLPTLILSLVALAWVALFTWAPSLVNPKHVIGEIEQQAIEAGTLTLYAVAATLLANVVLLLLVVLALVLLAAASQERRYLRLLERPAAVSSVAAAPAPSAPRIPPTTSDDTGA